MAEDVRVYEISTSGVANLNNNEICNETTSDADLSYRMWGGKDNSGGTTKWLAKDKNAQVVDLNVTGDITVVGGSITCDALSLSTAADYQVMYGDFQQASTFFWKGSKLRIGSTDDPSYMIDIESTSQDHLRLENSNADANGAFFVMDKNSASPADNDIVADIRLRGRDSGAAATDYGRIRATSLDVTAGTEDGSVIISAIAGASEVDAMVFEGDKVYTALNMGIGTQPETSGIFDAVEIGLGAMFAGRNDAGQYGADITCNSYYSSGWKYKNTDEVARYTVETGGTHIWYTATSGTADTAISWSEKMRIANDGNIGFGTPTLTYLLNVGGFNSGKNGVAIQGYSTTAARAFVGVDTSGSGLAELTSVGGIGAVIISSDGVSYLNGGNVGINETSPQDTLEVNGTILVKDKLKFTQDDGNEYIDSLADGYMDYGATTAHRFNTDDLYVDITNTRIGMNTAEPLLNIGGATGDLSGTGLHVKGAGETWLVIEGASSFPNGAGNPAGGLLFCDRSGAGDGKMMSLEFSRSTTSQLLNFNALGDDGDIDRQVLTLDGANNYITFHLPTEAVQFTAADEASWSSDTWDGWIEIEVNSTTYKIPFGLIPT